MSNSINLFVPGRLCILGEHSDWAGGHRRQNSNIEKGYAIVVPTNQGNYATVKKINKPIIRFITPQKEKKEIELKQHELFKCAQSNDFFSYISGVVYQIISAYNNIGGIEINNYKSDIPLKKGLSSSASICVLIARAYNRVFNLNWTIKREMEIAYSGEITTQSRCGKLDQACAYNKPVLITFDADNIEINPITIKEKLHFIIVDLNGKKDTKKILSALNIGYPFPLTKKDKMKHSVLGKINKELVLKGVEFLNSGRNIEFGKIMDKSQYYFDKYLSPYCEEELSSPKLHEIINCKMIRNFILGVKGVGSQGDGTSQILAKNKKCQKKVIKILEKKFNVTCLELNVL